MSQPFVGEVKFVAFNFPPRNYAFCNGQLLPIAQNQALFSILGTTFGGNGTQTFGLPNLQGRVPVHQGQGTGLPAVSLGAVGGENSHTLTIADMPAHNHLVMASNQAPTQPSPATDYLPTASTNLYASSANTTMSGAEIGNNGNGQPHNNMQPYQVVSAIIALVGIFPSRT